MRAIDYITGVGAFPTVCIFRPVIGADMERHPTPKPEEMRAVFAHVYEACRRNRIPIGAAPNIEVSLVVQPDDTRYLARPGLSTWAYEAWLAAARIGARPLFARKMRAGGRGVEAGAGGEPPPEVGTPAAGAASDTNGAPREPVPAGSLGELFERLRDTARRSPDLFELSENGDILELAPASGGRARAARCRLKVFRPREGRDRLCAFFYKRSNQDWSQDRYSYGGVEFLPGQVTEQEIRGWLDWLGGGFDPDQRPARLKRAFLYAIPD
jgi:hypothetical protein